MSQIDYRPLTDADFEAFADNLDLAFHEQSSAAERAAWRRLLPLDRSVIAFDGPRLVGTSAAYRQRLSIPGAELPCAGVTVVTVRPTHRRRGILTQMLARLTEQALAAGEPLAALWAAEGGIYERFGYGVAARRMRFQLPGGGRVPRPSLETPVADVCSVELRSPRGAGSLLAPLWERMRAQRPGMPSRTDDWWEQRVLADLPETRDGAMRLRLLVARDRAGSPQGYALYRVRPSKPGDTLEVRELIAPDPDAAAALWSFLSSVDLVGRLDVLDRPVDDPLPYRFADFDQARVTECTHALWLRLLDLPAALEARSWAAALDLTFDVTDDRVPANAGRWRLEVSADGAARCTRTDREADLVLDVAALSAAYLGGAGATMLADAGRIAQRTPSVLERLDAALHVPRAPWTPEQF
jgi:predicted acetyltransferase